MGLIEFYTQNKITTAYIILRPVLFFLSGIYLFFLSLRRWLYARGVLVSHRSGLKVYSVGNITLGGSGKTPLVEYIARRLASRGQRVGILLRGYKKPKKDLKTGTPDYYAYGDEAGSLKENLGAKVLVLTGANRRRLIRRLEIQDACDAVILDDGFQHWAVQRDLDIVAVDAARPFGNGCLLPLGILREGLGSLSRADVLVISRCDEVPETALRGLEERLSELNPAAPVLWTIHEPRGLYDLKTKSALTLGSLSGAKVCLFCGIANPLSFLRSVEKLGAQVALKFFFPDHHDYCVFELERLLEQCRRSGVKTVITTQKDAQRINRWVMEKDCAVDVLVFTIALKVLRGEEVFDERLFSLGRV